jgi:LacI family transcriptional regulator
VEALQAHGFTYDESLVVESNLQLEDGRESMQKLLALPQMPDGIFSASAYGVMGALQVLKEKGIKVPQEIALIGFTNEPFCSFSEPALSTVDQHNMRMGNAAAEIFLEEIADEEKKFIPQKIVLKPELIIRQSSLRKKS